MIKRKAGINVKISDVFRKRALFGVAIFCITAIATVGALSIGGKEEDNTPDSLVDLNGTEKTDAGQQVAEGENNRPEVQNPGYVATNPDINSVGPLVKDPGQMAELPDNSGKEPEIQNPDQVAEQPDNNGKEPEPEKPAQVAENPVTIPEEPEQTEVLSPQLIAEQLNFDKSAGLIWPVPGDVVIPYSPDHGVFYQTLDQFSTSEAIVLSSTVGTEVKAAAKGVVTAIEEDVRTGTTVTLALGNNTSLVYGQLEVADLKEGDVVEAGECLGTVAEPTRYYVVEGPNLYFQVNEGENSIDPTELLITEKQ